MAVKGSDSLPAVIDASLDTQPLPALLSVVLLGRGLHVGMLYAAIVGSGATGHADAACQRDTVHAGLALHARCCLIAHTELQTSAL